MMRCSSAVLVFLAILHTGLLIPVGARAETASLVIGASAAGGTTARPALPHSVELPAPRTRGTSSLEESLQRRRSVREFATGGLTLAELGQLLWAAQGLTSRRGGRTAPSAGALYPLEIHVVVGDVTGLEPAVYRYVPAGHRLERLATGDRRSALAGAALGQGWLEKAPVTVAFSAVYGRITGKYGERGVRYAHFEVGHAAQNLLLQASALGLGAVVVGAFDDGRVREVLGLSGSEQPLELVPVGHPEK